MTPVLTTEEVAAFLADVFPQAAGESSGLAVAGVGPGEATVRLVAGTDHLRPGGTVSGPALFGLMDYAAYVAILAHVGPVGLAVTTSAHVDFLVRPAPGPLKCRARLVKLGRRLAVAETHVRGEAGTLVARASLTYSLPPGWDAPSEAAAPTDAGA